MMKELWSAAWRWVLLLVVVVFFSSTYLGMYFANLQLQEFTLTGYGYNGIWSRYRFPTYRIGGDFADWLFRPINQLDQQVRPDYWSWQAIEEDDPTGAPAK